MPTSREGDVVPVRKATKRQLDALRGGRTYDAVIQDLLRSAPPAPAGPGRGRHPEEQVALAALAARRWRLAVERGEIVEAGPRLIVWHLPKEETKDGIRYTWIERRGLAT